MFTFSSLRAQYFTPDPKDQPGGENYVAREKEAEAQIKAIKERQMAMLR